jgi:hypothetical protein
MLATSQYVLQLTKRGFKYLSMTWQAMGPGGYCSPRYTMLFDSKKEGSEYEWMTWRTMSGRPYRQVVGQSGGQRLEVGRRSADYFVANGAVREAVRRLPIG